MKVLVTAAHPDDETLGCGGTIAKLSDLGHEVHLITFTDGISARESGDRRNTLESGSSILGIKRFKSLSFPDNMMDTVPLISVVKEIEKYLEENTLKPDWVLTHSPYCLNIDHSIVYRSTITAFRGMKKFNPIKIMCYEVPSSSEWNPIKNFVPNFYVDIEKYFGKKIEALKVYQEEMRAFPHPRSFENIESLAITAGAESGLKKSEKFMIIRETI